MKKPKHHIFVCGSFRANGAPQGVCNKKDSLQLLQYLEQELSDRGMTDVSVSSTGCLKLCDVGPAMIVYPQNWWYGRVENEGRRRRDHRRPGGRAAGRPVPPGRGVSPASAQKKRSEAMRVKKRRYGIGVLWRSSEKLSGRKAGYDRQRWVPHDKALEFCLSGRADIFSLRPRGREDRRYSERQPRLLRGGYPYRICEGRG